MKNLKKLDNLSEFKTKGAMTVNGGGGAFKDWYHTLDGKCAYKWTQCFEGTSYQVVDGKPKGVDCD